ncbi:MAG: hypothetical protein ABIC40_03120 [bacterium]
MDFTEEKEIITAKIAESETETEEAQATESSEQPAVEVAESGLKEEAPPEIVPVVVDSEPKVPETDHKEQVPDSDHKEQVPETDHKEQVDGESADKGDKRGKPSKPPYGHGRHTDGRRPRDRDGRPLSNEDKLRMYKRQSEERLLDIKRSRENKVGKKKR